VEGAAGDDVFKFIKKLKINKIQVLKKSGRVRINAVSNKLIPYDRICEMEQYYRKELETDRVELSVRFETGLPLNEALDMYWTEIIKAVSYRFPSATGILHGSSWSLENSSLIVSLVNGGTSVLESNGCGGQLEKLIALFFGSKVKVVFKSPEHNETSWYEYIEFKKNQEKKTIKESAVVFNQVPEEKDRNTDVIVIKGRDFKSEITPMNSISIDSERVSIEGDVFSAEYRETKKKAIMCTLFITDYTSSLTVKSFFTKSNFERIKEYLCEGNTLKIRGEIQYDSYAKDIVLMAKDIVKVQKKKKSDNSPIPRVELHMHTRMSSMDAVTDVADLVRTAAEWGHKAIAVTDHGVVQAFPDAYSAAKKHGIKIIFGMECYLLVGESVYHAVILVKNRAGLKNLYKIVSDSHLKYFHKRPRVPKELLTSFREGLLIGTACESGELFTAVLENRGVDELERIASFYDFLEIQPLGNNRFLVEGGRVSGMEALQELNRRIVNLGEKLNKPVVATCDVHFLNPEDEVFRRILMAGQGYADADRQAPLYLRTTEEMIEEFEYLGKDKAFEVVVKNTNAIADMIEEFPPVPEGTFPPVIEGSDLKLRQLAEGRAREIYGDPLPELVHERLQKELNAIIKNNFSVMYIIAWKLVSKSLADGYLVGSRGSVGSSFVANMAGITEVNSLPAHYICCKCKYSEFITDGSYDCGFDLPDKECPRCGNQLDKDGYDIPFETFLGFDGDKEPDIDLNFSGEYQPIAHKYTEEIFEKGHVFRAGTISTIASKTAYGFVRSYLDERGLSVTNAEIERLVRGCSGIKRTTGQHPGGVIIVPRDKEIYDFCPIQRPADDTGSEIITTHFDYDSISGTLLKLDILGHDDPTVIKMLEDMTGVDARTIPLADKTTMRIFSSTEPLGVNPEDIDSEVGTFGIPEFGTSFVRQMLVETRPTRFSELIKISGLSHGTGVWLNNAQEIIRSKTATLSEVICTRDDIMLYLQHKGLPPAMSFKIMEDLRKGRGLKEEYEKAMKEKGVPDWYIESCKKLQYIFPKAHAAAYVMMAFRIAWFKVHYPEAFYAAYFTVRADDFDASLMIHGRERVQGKISELKDRRGHDNGTMTQKDKNVLTILEVVNEMYARGIKFLPVDLYKSDIAKFIITDGSIRPPLIALQGLGLAAANAIAKAREEGEFLSVEDLRIRAGISKAVIEILGENGCLDGLPESNQLTLF